MNEEVNEMDKKLDEIKQELNRIRTPVDDSITLDNYKFLLKKTGLSQKEIAKRLGISELTISGIKQERMKLHKKHILSLIGLITVINNEKN